MQLCQKLQRDCLELRPAQLQLVQGDGVEAGDGGDVQPELPQLPHADPRHQSLQPLDHRDVFQHDFLQILLEHLVLSPVLSHEDAHGLGGVRNLQVLLTGL